MWPPIGFMGIGQAGKELHSIGRGEKIVSRELTPLPYMLGDMELLVFEEFPAEAKPSWEKDRELHVVERESDGPFRFSFAGPPRRRHAYHGQGANQLRDFEKRQGQR